MGLFYVTPHFQFNLEDLNHEIDMTWFVIADTARNAAEFWVQNFVESTEIAVKYDMSLTQTTVTALENASEADHVVEIRDLSFDAYATHGAVDWENILPTHFQIVEV